MSKRSEDNIERFFRKAASQYNDASTELREDDWRKMEKMLDEQADRAAAAKSRKWKIGGGIGGGVILLLLSFYFLTDVSTQSHQESQIVANDSSPDAMVAKPEAKAENSSEGLRDSGAEKSEDLESNPIHASNDGNAGEHQKENLISNAGVLSIPEKESSEATDVPSRGQPSAENRKSFEAGVTSRDGENISKLKSRESEDTQVRKPGDRLASEKEHAAIDAREKDKRHFTDGVADMVSGTEIERETSVDTDNLFQKETSLQSQFKESAGDRQVLLQPDTNLDRREDIRTDENNQEDATNLTVTGAPVMIRQEMDAAANNIAVDDSDAARMENHNAVPGTRIWSVINAAEAGMAESAVDSSEIKSLKGTNDQESRHQDDTTKLHDKNWPISKWSIALVAAPDFSGTGSGGLSSPGSAIGLAVHYRMSDRIAVSAGLIRTSKKYTAPGSDYHPPQGYWARRTNGITPDRINGTCMVLEIPLTLQYNLMEVEKNLLFVSAGISSYLMQHQQYIYTFQDENPGADTEWSSREPSNYFFSVGSITAGYERIIKPQLLIGLAPYVKVPFSGVGWPSVRLYTAGVYFTLRYRIIKSGSNL